jgi:hypothetical protein
LASATIAVPRFGPVVPVAPAAARVWQELQPEDPVKIALPAAMLAALEPPAAVVLVLAPPAVLVVLLLLVVLVPAPEPLFALFVPSDVPPVGAPAPAPGSPARAAFAGIEPIGGAAPAFWDCSQVWNACGVTTRTDARINA